MNTTSNIPSKRPRLLFLDGIRGVSALYIALYHSQLYAGHFIPRSSLIFILKPISKLISYGYLAVPVFIVLSGYCLAIPVVLGGQQELNGGFRNYIKRRAFRILPPYYFALLFFILLILAVPILQVPKQTAWDSKIPMDWGAIISHLFLVHNFNSEWVLKIDGPLWSVATEWQLYFLFPVILYFWKRFNLITTTLLSIIVSVTLSMIIVPAKVMHFWFLGLFAIGVLGSTITFSNEAKWVRLRSFNWRLITNLTCAIMAFILAINEFLHIGAPLLEILVGLTICVVITYYALIEVEGKTKPIVLSFLNKNLLISLGLFSYSIYLIHSPILGLINLITLDIPVSPSTRLLFMELIGVPLAILVSYIFYLLVERKFIVSHNTPKWLQFN